MTKHDCKLDDETFTHIDDVTGAQTVYNVTTMRRACDAGHEPIDLPMSGAINAMDLDGRVRLIGAPVEERHATFLIQHRGVERHRLLRLAESPNDAALKPIIFVQMPDNSWLLADGTHRYVLADIMQRQSIPAYVMPWALAQPHIIEDMPTMPVEAIMNSWSGY